MSRGAGISGSLANKKSEQAAISGSTYKRVGGLRFQVLSNIRRVGGLSFRFSRLVGLHYSTIITNKVLCRRQCLVCLSLVVCVEVAILKIVVEQHQHNLYMKRSTAKLYDKVYFHKHVLFPLVHSQSVRFHAIGTQ